MTRFQPSCPRSNFLAVWADSLFFIAIETIKGLYRDEEFER